MGLERTFYGNDFRPAGTGGLPTDLETLSFLLT
jgi:hypothetical protein